MLFLVCLHLFVSSCLASELYTSLTHVESLLDFDDLVGMTLIQLSQHTPVQKSYLKSYRWVIVDRNVMKSSRFDDVILGNPLHIYALFKRMVLYWPDIREELQTYRNQNIDEMIQRINSAQNITVFPTMHDLKGCAIALARLQQVYILNIEDMKQGRLMDHKSSVRLSMYDCLRIANNSFYMKHYSNSWYWYKAALHETEDPDTRYYILAHMDTVEHEHDSNWIDHEDWFLKKLRDDRNQSQQDPTYYKLCRGEQILSSAKRSHLRCHISHLRNPFLALRPIKYEELHYDPEMYLIYDVITDAEIQVLKQQAHKRLSRSTLQGGTDPSEIRVSQTAWLNNDSHPVLVTVTKRIKAITGLYLKENEEDKNNDNRGAEPLQVVSYGIGGHFLPHMDTFFKHKDKSNWEFSLKGPGDRLATWMFYLTDVVKGGRTAFPNAGVAVTPVKGAAAFWYNIYRNGYGNTNTKHGGCPVLMGHKWVANKWIFENNNVLRHPCGLHPDI